jgi:hypothetical protein
VPNQHRDLTVAAHVVAIVSDEHAGSTVAPCPPVVELDDGGEYHASKVQRWLWQSWGDFWDEAARVRDEVDGALRVVSNGDLVEGDHHGTAQIISRHPGIEQAVAKSLLEVPKSKGVESWHIVRGTESHVGKSGKAEEALARWLGAEPDPETGNASWWHCRMDLDGVRLDFAHHGRMGQRPWTRGNVVLNLAAEVFMEYAAAGKPHPHLAVRSHLHQWMDTGSIHPVRVIQTPGWQLKTGYVHKVAANSLIPHIGGALVLIRDGVLEWVRPVMFRAKEDYPVWTPASK